MKQRMYNTFYRKINNEKFAKVLANIGYFILMIYYVIVRNLYLHIDYRKEYDNTKVNQIRKQLMEECNIQRQRGIFKNPIIKKEIDLSIVMPAYNVEKYIKKCIESVVNQNTKYNYELIIVNDGSTDDTEDIIKKFDSNKIKYIKQENQGLSGARNTGIENAVGKYITFIDSDDIMEENAIEIMMDAMMKESADIVVGSYYMFVNDKGERQNCISEKRVIVNNTSEAVKNHGYAWGKIFKREIFNKVRFPLHMWYEDTLICTVIFRMKNKKVVVLDDMVYGYRINPEGISRTARSSKRALEHYWVLEDAIEQAIENNIENDEILYNLAVNHLSSLLYRRVSLLEDELVNDVFVLACNIVNELYKEEYENKKRLIERDIEKAFRTYNYKFWKLASFIV